MKDLSDALIRVAGQAGWRAAGTLAASGWLAGWLAEIGGFDFRRNLIHQGEIPVT